MTATLFDKASNSRAATLAGSSGETAVGETSSSKNAVDRSRFDSTKAGHAPRDAVVGDAAALGHPFADVIAMLAGYPVDDCSESDLRQLLTCGRRMENAVHAFVYRIGARADRLAAQGKAAPSEDFLSDGGKKKGASSRRDSRRSKTVADNPEVGEAAAAGDIGDDQIDSVSRRLQGLSDEERSRIDLEKLMKKAKTMSADRFDKALREAVERARSDKGKKENADRQKTSEFRHWFDHVAGMGKFSGQLDPLRYEALTAAIDQHVGSLAANTSRDQDDGASVSKDSELAATALHDLVCSSGGRSQHLPHVTVVVDADTLAFGEHDDTTAETGNGHRLNTEEVSRLCCDTVLQKVVLNNAGVPINVGRKYRTATESQWIAVRSVHSTCAFDSCDRPLSWCQLHHINYWRNNGQTDLDNLVPLCSAHHHRVHEGGWTIKLKPDRALEIYKPDGSLHATGDPPTRKPETLNRERGKPSGAKAFGK